MTNPGRDLLSEPLETCHDCNKVRPIVLRFKAVESGVIVEVKLCKGCLRNRRAAAKRGKQNH